MTTRVIVPTVRGREQVFDRVVAAWKAQSDDVQVVVVRNAPTVGDAWNAAYEAQAAAFASSDVVVFAIDDAIPQPGALDAARRWAESGAIPSPRLTLPDGTVEACGSMGGGMFLPDCADGTPCRSAGIIAATVDTVTRVGRFLPIHYYVDDDWCWRAHLIGVPTVAAPGFHFEHVHATAERARMQGLAHDHKRVFLASAANPATGVLRPASRAARRKAKR